MARDAGNWKLLTMLLAVLMVPMSHGLGVEMQEVVGSISLDSSVCSELVNVSRVPNPRSVIECVLECEGAGCAAVAWFSAESPARCQLLTLSGASVGGGGGCLTPKLLQASPPTVQVFKKADLNSRVLSASVYMAFNVTNTGPNGAVQSARVNLTGCYRAEARGARGGSSWIVYNPAKGGSGASVAGNFSLPAGLLLSIVVGQRGSDTSQANDGASAGGGGGSFVYLANGTLLLAAGGGGGAGRPYTGRDGQAGPNGSDSYTADWPQNNGQGGANGQPADWVNPNITQGLRGGPGAGWLGAASTRTNVGSGDRGGSLAQGWVGGDGGAGNSGADGGFGGGGGGGAALGAGGGGGGYSGGGAGTHYKVAGGGGGSFCGGVGCVAVTGGNTDSDNGFIIIRLLSLGVC